MKENARLIGILVFFVLLVAVTWKWQQSGSDAPSDPEQLEQSANESTSDYTSRALEVPTSQGTNKKETPKKKTVQKPAPVVQAGTDYRKVHFPPGEGVLHGKVIMGDNKPIPPDMLVVLHFVTDKSHDSFALDTSVLESTIDDAGNYRFEELPVGRYHLYAEAEGYVGHSPAELTKKRMSREQSISIREATTIRGIVIDGDGNPVNEASVFAVSWKQGGREQFMVMSRSRSSQNLTDEEGKFTIRNVQVLASPLEYKLMASADGFANTVTDFLKVGREDVEITLQKGQEITGTVINASTGSPVPNIKVMQAEKMLLARVSDMTDMKGTFKLVNVSPGTYPLDVEHDSFILKEGHAPVNVEKEIATEPVTLNVVAGGILAGRTMEIDSREPVPNATIRLRGRNKLTAAINETTTADANGHFRFEGLPSGPYQLAHESVRGFARTTPPDDRDRENRYEQLVHAEIMETTANLICYYKIGLRIAGKVVDSKNEPIAEANVSGYSQDRDRYGVRTSNNDRTDANGRFLLSGFSAGQSITIQANKNSYGRGNPVQIEIQPPGVSNQIITLAAGGSISGTIVDRNGNPLAGGEIHLETGGRHVNSMGIQNEGAFNMAGLSPGSYILYYDHYWFQNQSGGVREKPKLGTVSLYEGQQVTDLQYSVDIDMSHTISGYVTNSQGEPVPASVRANAESSGYGRGSVTADETGYYEVKGLMETTYRVTASHNDYNQKRVPNVDAPSSGINITLEGRASVAGMVIDGATGQPIPAFEVGIFGVNQPVTFGTQRGQLKSFTDPDGKFHYEKITVGDSPRKLVATAKGYGFAEFNLGRLRPAENRTNIQLTLSSAATVEGTVTDSSGAPVKRAKVGPSGNSIANREDEFVVYTDADGRYTLESVPQGEITLAAYKKDLNIEKTTVSITGSGTFRADFQLRDGSVLEGIVTLGDTPLPNAQIQTYPMDGSGINKNAYSNADGYYRIENLPAREFQIIARTGSTNSGNQRRRTINAMTSVLPGEIHRLNLHFPAVTASLEGKILGQEGTPIPNANISLRYSTDFGSESFNARTDANGDYAFQMVPAGTITATIRFERIRFGTTFELKENENKEKDFQLNAGATLIGSLAAPLSSNRGWILLLFNSTTTINEPLDMRFLNMIGNQALNQAQGPQQQLTMTNVQPGAYKIMALTFGENANSTEEMLADSLYSFQTITVKENETIEIHFDL
jgi:hypothetical protein